MSNFHPAANLRPYIQFTTTPGISVSHKAMCSFCQVSFLLSRWRGGRSFTDGRVCLSVCFPVCPSQARRQPMLEMGLNACLKRAFSVCGPSICKPDSAPHQKASFCSGFFSKLLRFFCVRNSRRRDALSVSIDVDRATVGTYLSLPSEWAGYYTCPALRPYQFGPMRNPDVTKGHSNRL